MNGFLLTFAIFMSLASTKHEVQIVDGTMQSKRTQVLEDGQPVQVDLRKMRVTIKFPSGKTRQADITMLHEPRHGLFWWDYYEVPEQDQPSTDVAELTVKSKFYIIENKIVAFTFSRSLWIRECVERHSSMNDGQAKVFSEIESKAGEIEKGQWEWFHEINVAKVLGFDFFHLKGSASPFPEPRLREVTRKGAEWHLTFDGPNKDSAEVVLGDDYQVVSVNRSPASPG
jgi:hypothetical protein